MKKIRIACIGTNQYSHGWSILAGIKKQTQLFDLVGYVMPENEKEKIPDVHGLLTDLPELTLEEVLADPGIEAVAIETDEIYLTQYAQMAAEHHKHIHMEKPGGISLAEFSLLIDTVRRNSLVFHVGYMYRYHPQVQDILKRVRAGEFGDIISVEAQMNCYHPQKTRQWLSGFPGGMMFYLGCHLMDLVMQIQGLPLSVHPFLCCTETEGASARDFGMGVLQYPRGYSLIKASAVEIGGYARRQLVISGTKGTVEIKPLEMPVIDEKLSATVTEYRNPQDWCDRGFVTHGLPFDRYDSMMASFAAMVRGEKENPWNYDYELNLYKSIMRLCGGNEDE